MMSIDMGPAGYGPRDRMVAIVQSCVGLAAEGATLGEYDQAIITSGLDLMDPAKRHAMQLMSSCLLFMREVFRRFGIRHPRLDAPYDIAMAERDIIEIAESCGALLGPDATPAHGDGVIIDGPGHGMFVTSVSLDGARYVTVQGGERLADGVECIRAIERPYIVGMHGASFGNRPVKHVIDCAALSAHVVDSW